jgi:hypothetical protein
MDGAGAAVLDFCEMYIYDTKKKTVKQGIEGIILHEIFALRGCE